MFWCICSGSIFVCAAFRVRNRPKLQRKRICNARCVVLHDWLLEQHYRQPQRFLSLLSGGKSPAATVDASCAPRELDTDKQLALHTHFTADSYEAGTLLKLVFGLASHRKLKRDAVPTLFKHTEPWRPPIERGAAIKRKRSQVGNARARVKTTGEEFAKFAGVARCWLCSCERSASESMPATAV